jgi:DNA-binding transcriptional ArsR family regulator
LDPKTKAILEEKTKIFKALAHPTRLRIVEQLANEQRCVCEFVQDIKADFSTVSKHLTILKQAGIVEDEKKGKQVFYRLKTPCVLNFTNCLEKVIKNQLKSQTDLWN